MSSPSSPCAPVVNVQLPNGQTLTVNIPTHAQPICEVKRAIFQSINLPPLQSRVMSGQSGVDQLELPINMVCTQRGKRVENKDVTVRTFSEVNVDGLDTFKLRVDDSDSMLDLKFLLAPRCKMPPDYIRLYFHFPGQRLRTPLKDNVLVSSLPLQANNPLRMSYELPSGEKGHGAIHRTSALLREVERDNMKTVAEAFLQAAQLYPKRRYMGTRKFEKNGERGEYQWLSYEQAYTRVMNLGSGLRALGLKKNESVGIVSQNRTEWTLTDLACTTQSLISVPLYDTLGADAIEFIINHASVRVVVASVKELKAIHAVRSKCPTLEHVIVMDDNAPDQQVIAKMQGMFTYTLSGLEKLGSEKKVAPQLPTPQDIFTICYTSGTTGNPKGAVITHGNMMAAITALNDRAPAEEKSDKETMLSYLPAAHIYERVVQTSLVTNGYAVGFSQGDNTKLVEDVQALKPTVFPGVPRVWQRIHDRIHAQIDESGFLKRFMFNKAFNAKLDALYKGEFRKDTIYDKIVFSALADRFGGNVKLMASGAAPLSPKVAEFMRIAFKTHFVEGYGLTETCAALTCQMREDAMYGHVGLPLSCVEVKLVDVPDMEYLTSDKPNPRGEIWVRGPNVFKGYYKQPDITAEVISKDGWFATGDVGTWLPDGSLKIIDRKKNLFKLSQGEYIRPEHIEGVYKQSKAVANIFVHGDSNENYLVAVVFPDVDALNAFAQANGLNSKNVAELVKDARVIKWLESEMESTAKKEQLRGFEVVKKFFITHEDFSVENGILTPTFKLKRNVAAKYYAKQIEAMYKGGDKQPAAAKIQSKL